MKKENELLPIIKVNPPNLAATIARIRKRSHDLERIEDTVEEVILGVRARGDSALVDYAKLYDRTELKKSELRVSPEKIRGASERISPSLLRSMRDALGRLQSSQSRLRRQVTYTHRANGFTSRVVPRPMYSAGCYVPGGRAVYPSSVLMTAGTAKVAGVERVVVCTPPDPSGEVSDAVLAAANLCGVEEVYAVGGAQAIAAMAYGTESIGKVEKIVGPGGVYASVAKRLVSRDVAIDFFAGPTELLVVGDDTTDPRLAAWDIVAQAEHGQDSICGLATWSGSLADEVRSEVEKIVPKIKRREYVEGCLQRGFAAVCSGREGAAEFASGLAPEHVELMCARPLELEPIIRNAGLVLCGPYAPCAASDYLVGTDHVLPTDGYARIRSGLSVLDFLRLTFVVDGTKAGLEKILPSLESLASSEGLTNHYLSVKSRF